MENEKNIISTEAEVKNGQIIETKKPQEEVTIGEKVLVKRGRVDSLTIFEIRQDELTIIEKGSSNSIYLNFAIFLLSIAISFLIAILTSDYTGKVLTFSVFCVISSVGFILGVLLLILWLKLKDDFKEIIKNIKKRIEE